MSNPSFGPSLMGGNKRPKKMLPALGHGIPPVAINHSTFSSHNNSHSEGNVSNNLIPTLSIPRAGDQTANDALLLLSEMGMLDRQEEMQTVQTL